MSSIKTGDRVRATNGESVLVGVVTDSDYTHSTRIKVDRDSGFQTSSGRTVYHPEWTLERILPAEPPPGTVVRVDGMETAGNNGLWMHHRVGFDYPWYYINGYGSLLPGADWQYLNKGTVEVLGRSPDGE